MPRKSPLDLWIAAKIGVKGSPLTRHDLGRYQLQKLRETVTTAQSRSSFYGKHLGDTAGSEISSLADLSRFPFTTADDLVRQSLQLLCVPQSEIDRVVTLASSGTTGEPKRVFFTADDQELAIDFFRHGVATMARPGDAMLILLPGERPGSVGQLLAIGLARFGIRPILHPAIHDTAATVELIAREQPQCLIGMPVQLLALARYASEIAGVSPRPNSVVLVSDHVPDSIVRLLRQAWGCDVFEHYGMTEMGLGGGVDCEGHSGYHLREADLYFEIVDVETGAPVPDGETGEVVFTTLTRRGMPLIRYRTGDISRFLPGACPCGSVLRRLDRVRSRKSSRVLVGDGHEITMAALDEVLFGLGRVIDFAAAVVHGAQATLRVEVTKLPGRDDGLESTIRDALDTVPQINEARRAGNLDVSVSVVEGWAPKLEKRTIKELRVSDGEQNGVSPATRNAAGLRD